MTPENLPPIALVTGASSGIGYEISKELANKGFNLILVARREERLKELKNYLESEFGAKAYYLKKDLSELNSANELHQEVLSLLDELNYENLDVLVNNAGVGDLCKFEESSIEKLETMINLNILSLSKLSRLFLDSIQKSKDRAIINIASTAAFQALPQMAVYAATKAYVLSFSEAIAEEMKNSKSKVKVICICPGITESEFQVRADMSDLKINKQFVASSEAVAKYTVKSLEKGKTTAVHGIINKIGTLLPRLLPRSAIARMSNSVMNKIT